MPQCSDYGPGWVGEHPNCRYEASTPTGTGQQQQQFTGTVGSLGYGEELAGSSWEQDWEKFFDPYDPAREEMTTRHAGIDVGQLQSAWDLQSGQLTEALELGREQQGEAWRLQEGGLGEQWAGQRGELGAGARRGYQDVTRMGERMKVQGRGLTFGEQRERQAEEEVTGAYERSFGLGQSAYERAIESGQSRYRQALEAGTMGYGQAIETGELGLQQATTDIYQGLESDIFGQRESWEEQNRATLNVLLGSGIWSGNRSSGGGDDQEGWTTCCDGTSQPMAALCGVGNQPQDCYAAAKGGTNPPAGTCTNPKKSKQNADGTCVGSALECMDTGTDTGTGTNTGTNTGGGTGGGSQSGAQRFY